MQHLHVFVFCWSFCTQYFFEIAVPKYKAQILSIFILRQESLIEYPHYPCRCGNIFFVDGSPTIAMSIENIFPY